jgi:hypothetical protein
MMVRMAEQQNFANHVRRVPGFMALAFVLLVTTIGAGVNLYQSWGDHERLYNAALILVLCLCSITIAGFARSFALKAQDRAIRAEENLRSYVLTGKLLDPALAPGQIAALRFACDKQFPQLAEQAVTQSMKPVEIKKAVVNWRADWHRV